MHQKCEPACLLTVVSGYCAYPHLFYHIQLYTYQVLHYKKLIFD